MKFVYGSVTGHMHEIPNRFSNGLGSEHVLTRWYPTLAVPKGRIDGAWDYSGDPHTLGSYLGVEGSGKGQCSCLARAVACSARKALRCGDAQDVDDLPRTVGEHQGQQFSSCRHGAQEVREDHLLDLVEVGGREFSKDCNSCGINEPKLSIWAQLLYPTCEPSSMCMVGGIPLDDGDLRGPCCSACFGDGGQRLCPPGCEH